MKKISDRFVIICLCLILLSIGLIAIWDMTSANFYFLRMGSNDSLYFVKRQILFLIVGMALMAVTTRWFYFIDRFRLQMCLIGIALLCLPFFLYVDSAIENKRWLWLFGNPVRTGLWAILLLMPFAMYIISVVEDGSAKGLHYLGFGTIIIVVNILFLKQHDMPMLVLFNLIVITMLLKKSNIHKKLLIGLAGYIFVIVIVAFYLLSSHHLLRWYSVWDYMSDRYGVGYQTALALQDIKAGGVFGQGLGYYGNLRGFDIYNYNIMHVISRFILQITGREFGLIGIAVVVVLFLLIGYFGIKLIRRIPDVYNRNLAWAMLLFIILPEGIGIMRTLNAVPFLPSYSIPFMGYGVEGTIIPFVSLGILFSQSIFTETNEDRKENS